MIPEGYELIVNKKKHCPLCELPELNDPKVTELIWSKKLDWVRLTQKINIDYEVRLDEKEVKRHYYHISLMPVSKEAIEKEALANKRLMELQARVNSTRASSVLDPRLIVNVNIAMINDELLNLKDSGLSGTETFIQLNESLRKWIELKEKMGVEEESNENDLTDSRVWLKNLRNEQLKLLEFEKKKILERVKSLEPEKVKKRLQEIEEKKQKVIEYKKMLNLE